jgi:O-antigen/teichoic acid export membrane protein
LLVSGTLAAASTVAIIVVPWARWLRLEQSPAAVLVQTPWVVGLSLCLVVLLIPLQVLKEIYTADQRGYVFSLFMAGGAMLSLAGVWIVWRVDAGWLGVVAALQGSIAVAYFALALYWRVDRLRWMTPQRHRIDRAAWLEMRGDCGWMFLMSVSCLLINSGDVFWVNLMRGGRQATDYALAIRFFLYGEVLLSFLLYPLWPMLGQALHAGDRQWARAVSRRVLWSVAGIAVLMYSLAATCGGHLVTLWTGGVVTVDSPLLYAVLAAWFLARAINYAFTVILRAHGRIRVQCAAQVAEAVLHMALVLTLGSAWGLVGVATGGLLAALVTQSWALPWDYVSTLRPPRSRA